MVNTVSIALIFIIIAITFKSLILPVILVLCIELAIFVNMGIPYFTGSTLPFIAGVVIGTIQLGACIDYAILMTTRYKEELEQGLKPKRCDSNGYHNDISFDYHLRSELLCSLLRCFSGRKDGYDQVIMYSAWPRSLNQRGCDPDDPAFDVIDV